MTGSSQSSGYGFLWFVCRESFSRVCLDPLTPDRHCGSPTSLLSVAVMPSFSPFNHQNLSTRSISVGIFARVSLANTRLYRSRKRLNTQNSACGPTLITCSPSALHRKNDRRTRHILPDALVIDARGVSPVAGSNTIALPATGFCSGIRTRIVRMARHTPVSGSSNAPCQRFDITHGSN
jgi:hypothetical protein